MNNVIGYGIAIAAPTFFYFYLLMILKKTKAISEIRTFTKWDWYISISIFAGATCFISFLIKQNQFIYYWDYGREWTTAINVSEELFANPVNALKSIYQSINESDYNKLMPVLIALPLKILGNSFTRYIVINMLFFMCPTLFIVSLLSYKILRKFSIVTVRFWNILLLVSLTPILYCVLLDGFMDIVILPIISALLLIAVDFDYNSVDVGTCFQIVIGILLMVLFRRYFAYWVVGYIFSLFFIAMYQIKSGDNKRKKFKVYVIDMMLIGGISLAILLTFFRQFFIRSIFNNFSYAYSAYDVPYIEKFQKLADAFGWGELFIAFVLAPMICRIYKGMIAIIFSYFCNIIVAIFLIWNEQQMGWHHYYLIVVQVMLLYLLGLFGFAEKKEKKKRVVIKVIGSIWCLMNIMICFMPILRGLNKYNLFASRYYEVKIRDDLENIHNMTDYVNEIANLENGKWVYVLSSSSILNSDILRKSELPFNMNAIPTLYGTKDVDLRDGFPEELFTADVVIVGEPIQTHLPDETQEIITYLSELILDSDSYLGRHYDCVNEFILHGDVTAKVYKRNSQYSKEDYLKLRKYFDGIYGAYPELFRDRIIYPTAFFPDEVGTKIVLTEKDNVFGTNCGKSVNHLVSTSEGHLVYGPGKRIEKGVYDIVFNYDYSGESMKGKSLGVVDVCLSLEEVASKDFKAEDTQVRLENVIIDDPDDKCELRMYVNVPGVKFQSVSIEKVK